MPRVLFPETGFTIDDAVAYYRAVSKVLLPHIRNRPMSFRRFVDTVRGESFWEKDAPSFTPAWVRRVRVPRRTAGESEIEYIVVNDARTLAWLARSGGIELHPFLHRVDDLDVATHVVFDLDPGEGADIEDCCRVALLLREALAAIGLESLAKVSGSKGVQVYVPLNSDATHAATEPFARVIAEELARAHPKTVTAKMSKTLRRGKVLVDWSQNADYKTTVAVYSLRGSGERPLVSMPVTWREISQRKPLRFEPEQAVARVRRRGDLFAGVLRLEQRLPEVAPLSAPRPPRSLAHARDDKLPKPGSQSGRRLFLLTKTEMGNELWLDVRGRFRRWILRRDRTGGGKLIAMPAGEFDIDPAYYRREIPAKYRGRTSIEDAGAYEVIEGSDERRRFELWFSGKTLTGAWTLQKVTDDDAHRSWSLAPAK